MNNLNEKINVKKLYLLDPLYKRLLAFKCLFREANEMVFLQEIC